MMQEYIPQQWEYLTQDRASSMPVKELNLIGEEGWELVSNLAIYRPDHSSWMVYTFKRLKPNGPILNKRYRITFQWGKTEVLTDTATWVEFGVTPVRMFNTDRQKLHVPLSSVTEMKQIDD